MNASELLGRSILDLTTATTIGQVDDVVIATSTRRVAGLRIAKSTAAGDWLAWDRLAAVGPDAITVESADRLAPFVDDGSTRALRGNRALGGRVLSDEGRELGVLSDVEFDEDGTLTGVLVGAATLPPESLLGIGSYATVVHDPA